MSPQEFMDEIEKAKTEGNIKYQEYKEKILDEIKESIDKGSSFAYFYYYDDFDFITRENVVEFLEKCNLEVEDCENTSGNRYLRIGF